MVKFQHRIISGGIFSKVTVSNDSGYYYSCFFNGKLIKYKNIVKNKVWLKNGKIHREIGPAVLFKNGDRSYYYNGEEIAYSKTRSEIVCGALIHVTTYFLCSKDYEVGEIEFFEKIESVRNGNLKGQNP